MDNNATEGPIEFVRLDDLVGLDCLETSDRATIDRLADTAIDRVVHALQRDDRMPKLSRIEWELVLANARDRIAEALDIIDGAVSYDDVNDIIARADVYTLPAVAKKETAE